MAHYLPLLIALLDCIEVAKAINAKFFFGCGLSDYYSQLPGDEIEAWTREDLQGLVTKTHREILPESQVRATLEELDIITPNDDQVDTADLLDGGLIPYEPIPDWDVGFLWPKQKGIRRNGPEYTDLHNLKPASPEEVTFRSDLLLGECGVFCDADDCRSPPLPDLDVETSSDGVIFSPPSHLRGDFSRALFYMKLRYNHLNLTDCPQDLNDMGYLSQLLEWHDQDPVDDKERIRNEKVCQHWQGNRNPFVDAPQLASILFGRPRQLPLNSCTSGSPSTETYRCYGVEDSLSSDILFDSPTNITDHVVDSLQTGMDASRNASPASRRQQIFPMWWSLFAVVGLVFF